MTINNNTGPSRSCNWNEYNLKPLTRNNWRASLVPAAAVIPAPIAYIKVVAVKKLVVEFLACAGSGPLLWSVLDWSEPSFGGTCCCPSLGWWQSDLLLWEKLECSKQAYRLNTLAWNNKIGLWFYFVGLRTKVMINRDSWGYSYLIVRGEILGFIKDELMRKHLPRMFSLIKNES